MKIPEKIRLQRMIALSSELSRRAAEDAIRRGEVFVNGRVVTELGTSVDPLRDKVYLRGKLLSFTVRRIYIAFFKPRNVLVTKYDSKGRSTIWDGLKEWKDRLNSVGRLDFESEGLLLLTDDGDFLNLLTHPRHEIWKLYHVRVKGEPTDEHLKQLRDGVMLSDGPTLPAKVKRMDKGGSNALLEIAIREGRNREVRRMCDTVGYPVIKLRRIAVGPVRLGSLKVGRWRHLRPEEIAALISKARS